jgi:hypothetical protein
VEVFSTQRNQGVRPGISAKPEEARQEDQDKVNAIKSMCLSVANGLVLLKENLEAMAKICDFISYFCCSFSTK